MKFLSTIFFLLVVQETLFSAIADRKFIENTCKGTPNYDLCLSIILADPKSEKADLTSLALIAVAGVEHKGDETIKQIKDLKSSKPELRPALDYCTQVYHTIVKVDVPMANDALKLGNPKFGEDGMADSAVETQACEGSFEEHGMTSPMTKQNKAVEAVANVARAIIQNLYPEFLGREDRIVDFPEGKVGVYTKFFEFANYRIPISQFLFDILGHYQIHMSQLSIIGAAKRVSAPKDGKPVEGLYSVEDVAMLNTRRTPIQKQPEALLCLVDMDLLNLISAPNPAVIKTGTRSRAAHEVPLLTTTANRVINMEDPATATESSRTPSTIEKSPLDFDNENPSQQAIKGDRAENLAQETVASETLPSGNSPTTRVALKIDSEEEVAVDAPLVSKRRYKRGNDGANANASPKVLRKDFDATHPTQSIVGGKSLASMGLEAGSILVAPASHETPASTIDPDPLSYANPQSGDAVMGDTESEHTSFTSMAGSPGNIYQPEWGVTNGCRLDTPEVCQDLVDHLAPPGYFSKLRHLPNDDFLHQYNMNLAWQVAMSSQLRLRYEQEVKLLKKYVAQVARRDQRIHATESEIRNLQALLEAEADLEKVAEANNVELSKELESLRAKFSNLQVNNNQLSQQVATLQAQVIGEERIKAAFEEFKKYEDDRVSARCAEMDARLDALSIDFDEELYPHMLTAIAGHRWVIGHGLCLAVLKYAESLELRQAFANVVSAGIAKGFCDGLKYGVEQGEVELDLANIEACDPKAEDKFMATMQVLKDLKYPLIDELEKLNDAPMDIIPVYPEVRDPRYPWDVKEEMLLEDAIAANKSQAEKKRKCRIICRSYRDATAQTEPPEDRSSPRLVRSKSLPSMYNLDWP
ncbi:gypsy type transposase [Tanacetum coccineum]